MKLFNEYLKPWHLVVRAVVELNKRFVRGCDTIILRVRNYNKLFILHTDDFRHVLERVIDLQKLSEKGVG